MDKSILTTDFTNVIKWVLEEIKKETFATKENEYVYYSHQQSSDLPSIEDQRRVLQFLEKDNAIKIINPKYQLKYVDKDTADYLNLKPKGYYIDILQPRFDEIYLKYNQEGVKSEKITFNAKTGLLKFAGQEIELSKKGKETDAVLLLNTLLQEETADWKYNDEILNDWGYNDDDIKDLPKNKVYFAGQKINNAVAIKTQIKDFIECNTTKARVNPKYRKVDE